MRCVAANTSRCTVGRRPSRSVRPNTEAWILYTMPWPMAAVSRPDQVRSLELPESNPTSSFSLSGATGRTDFDHQAFAREQVDHRERPEAPLVRQFICHEVDAPNVVSIAQKGAAVRSMSAWRDAELAADFPECDHMTFWSRCTRCGGLLGSRIGSKWRAVREPIWVVSCAGSTRVLTATNQEVAGSSPARRISLTPFGHCVSQSSATPRLAHARRERGRVLQGAPISSMN
jgi:hypothetical protein